MNHAVIKSRENQITQQVGLNLPKMQEKMNQSEFGWFGWNLELAKLLTTSSEFYAMLKKKKKECLFLKGVLIRYTPAHGTHQEVFILSC